MRGPVIMRPVYMALALVLLLAGGMNGAPAKEKMPALQNAIPYHEWENTCRSNGAELVIFEYDTLESQNDPDIKYMVVFRKGDVAPFMVAEDTDTVTSGSVVLLYYDFDLDGFVDLKMTNMDDDFLSACQAVEKVRKKA